MRLRRIDAYENIGDVQKQIVTLLVLERKAETPESKAVIEKCIVTLTERLDELMEGL